MNFLDVTRANVARADPRNGVCFLRYGKPNVEMPYDAFLRTSAWLGRKIPEDATVVIAADDPLPALLAFFGALWTGGRPLILPSPHAAGGMEQFQTQVRRTLGVVQGEVVLALQDGIAVESPGVPVVPLPADADGYDTLAPGDLPESAGPGGDTVAFLQATSASTGDPKLIGITHANVCANLTTIERKLGRNGDERLVTWLPLYHDMGLVGMALLGAFRGWPLYVMKPIEFVMRPHTWIDALSRYRGTLIAAPTFGYDHVRRKVAPEDVPGCDLSALRTAVVGAEPIRLDTLDGFHRRFAPAGLRAGALVCGYGMAETTLAAALSEVDAPPRYVLVDPAGVETGAPVRLLGEGVLGGPPPGGPGIPVFSCGPPLDGMTAALIDEEGRPVEGDAILGEITLTGPNIAAGYLDPDTGAPRPFPDGVLRTGDLGFRQRGELFVLERRKHVIIRNGRNHLASLLEERVAGILGRPVQEVMVLDADIYDPGSEIVAVVEHCPARFELDGARRRALRTLDLPVDSLHLARRRVIPRTTSGKKRYHTARRRLADGTLRADTTVALAGAR
ncbi:AMP-binding protein [Actinomadura syzygii]|uniref:AMP-binding protein n=1 Tax=Actinomadura syzygii TaxID=1427538 RepID=UPI001CA33F65|nr:AMP-binding protein [Actinomadura syzygii]